jgi:hypothetical protein
VGTAIIYVIMPVGPVRTPTRAGGWAANRNPVVVESGASSGVYGADTQFNSWNTAETNQNWAKASLPGVQVDPRHATRRLSPLTEKTGGASAPQPIVPVVGDKLDTRFALYPPSRDEVDTAEALINGVNGVVHHRLVRMSPTHHINAMGEFSGYRFSASSKDSCSALPINRTMFHGTSAVQCMSSKTYNGGSTSMHSDVTRLTADMPHCIATMKALMNDISKDAADSIISKTVACFECSPCNTDAVVSLGSIHSKPSGTDSSSRARDSRAWVCDEPVTIGIYHAFVRRFNHPREHRLFIVVTGGCKTACDQMMNLNTDLAAHTETTASEVCESDEVWWLRKLCSRMRARLLHRTALAFNLDIPVMTDAQAFDPSQLMAVTHVETCTHDIASLRNGDIAVYNECVDTTAPRNGILCAMNLSEGFWLFKGPQSANNGAQDYGVIFGNHSHCGVFPTSAPRVYASPQSSIAGERPIVTDFKNDGVFCYKNPDVVDKHTQYMKFDENFMRNLETMSWQRDNSFIELMPIVIGVFN